MLVYTVLEGSQACHAGLHTSPRAAIARLDERFADEILEAPAVGAGVHCRDGGAVVAQGLHAVLHPLG